MSELNMLPFESLGYNFIAAPYIPQGKDEYYLRNIQSSRPAEQWRHLQTDEIEILVRNSNTSDSWDNLLVTDEFAPQLVKNCEFYGLVRIGRLENVFLKHHDLRIPVGLTNSRIISCDIGDDVAIHNVRYLAHYIVGNNVVLLNLDEMHTTNHAKFGNGIVKKGEQEDVRVWLDIINENGGRAVMPFDGMVSADAYIWAKFRDDKKLLDRFCEITQKTFDPRRGFYGSIDDGCVIKNCRVIKDVKVGPNAYIKGANKLKNLTINSSCAEPTQIGEGVELVNGIVGFGCKIFYGCKAVRFVMGDNSSLKYGARLINSCLGDNSTISCCEVLNNLVFPSHEQHHNNSFLTASLVKGQSNIAACATIGSNHNSRAPDGEIEAGRGFWPGLCVSIKHFCRFASFVLLAKGDFPAEMNIKLPFSLVSNDVAKDELQVLPGYWWLYNMYALARNTWKWHARDNRKNPRQNIEFDSLAPDTVEEIFEAMGVLELWTAKAHLRSKGEDAESKNDKQLQEIGKELLSGPAEELEKLEVLGEGMENSSRKVVITKVHAAYGAYRQMLYYYSVKNIIEYMKADEAIDFKGMCKALSGKRQKDWFNIGGQLVLADDLSKLKKDIKTGKLDSWDDIHDAYDALWKKYALDKQRHAFACLESIGGKLTPQSWQVALDEVLKAQLYICDQTYVTRKKDFENPFRQMTFDNTEELEAVMGTAEKVSFVTQVQAETKAFAQIVKEIKERG